MKNVIKLTDGNPKILDDDPWVLQREVSGQAQDANVILPLNVWQSNQDQAVLEGERLSVHGVLLQPNDEPEDLAPWLGVVPLIAIDFPRFSDGRGYSQAYLLRTRLNWRGELRAVGDVLRDQLAHMRQCGFNTFAVREDKPVADALKGLAGVSVLYSRSAIEPHPLFRRREK